MDRGEREAGMRTGSASETTLALCRDGTPMSAANAGICPSGSGKVGSLDDKLMLTRAETQSSSTKASASMDRARFMVSGPFRPEMYAPFCPRKRAPSSAIPHRRRPLVERPSSR